MSRARHKLTGTRHALHNNAKTYQDDSAPNNGTEIIVGGGGGGGWGNTFDGDSYILKVIGGPIGNDGGDVDYGEPSDWHDSQQLKVGSSYRGNYNAETRITRMLYNSNLFAGQQNPLNSNTVIKNAVLRLIVAGGKGATFLAGDVDLMNSRLCNIYRNRQTLPDDIDVTYSWWENWGPLAINQWGTDGAENVVQDIDTTVTSSFYLLPQDWAINSGGGGPTWAAGDEVFIDFTELVQDAVSNRGGLLKTIWIKREDDGGDVYNDTLNETYFYSGNDSTVYVRPTLIIDWHNP